MKKKSGMKPKNNRFKVRSEHPQVVFLKWLAAELKTLKSGDTLHLSLDKLMTNVFEPGKIGQASAYLFMKRLCANECVKVRAYGHVMTTGSNAPSKRGFLFIPNRPSPAKTKTVLPVEKVPPPEPGLLAQILSNQMATFQLMTRMTHAMSTLANSFTDSITNKQSDVAK